jgi:iron complex transport system ATP-binding protein
MNSTLRLGTERLPIDKDISALLTMHDINLAAAYSDYLVFLNEGRVDTYGGTEVVTPELVKRIYNIDVDVVHHKGATVIIPDIQRDL